MCACHLALVIQATFLIIVLRSLVALKVPVVQHVDFYEVDHLVVHDFALADLKSQVLVVLVVL